MLMTMFFTDQEMVDIRQAAKERGVTIDQLIHYAVLDDLVK